MVQRLGKAPVKNFKWGPTVNGVRTGVEIPRQRGIPDQCHCGKEPYLLRSRSADYGWAQYYTCPDAAPGKDADLESCGFIKWRSIAVDEEIEMLKEEKETLEAKVEALLATCEKLEAKVESLLKP